MFLVVDKAIALLGSKHHLSYWEIELNIEVRLGHWQIHTINFISVRRMTCSFLFVKNIKEMHN